jgi:hypothetical protein
MNLNFLRNRETIKFCLSLLIIGILAIAIHIVYSPLVSAQSSTEFRGEINYLRSQINSLQSAVRSLQQSNLRNNNQLRPSTPPPNLNSPPVVNGEPIGTTDPMFQRLATLVIELKEDVRNLEKRMTEVEQKLAISH